MPKSVEEFQSRAEACRAAAAVQSLERVRQVQLEAAVRWEMLAEQAQWIPDAEGPVTGVPSSPARRRAVTRDVPPRILAKPATTIEAPMRAVDRSPVAAPSAPPTSPMLLPCEVPPLPLHSENPPNFVLSGFDGPTLPAPAADDVNVPLLAANGHIRTLEEIEADVIRSALAFYRGQISKVARRLGIGRSTLYRKMIDYGIEKPR